MPSGPFGGQVPVCMQCGSREIRSATVHDGLWPGGGEGLRWVCDRCGYQGAPLLVAPGDAPPRDAAPWGPSAEPAGVPPPVAPIEPATPAPRERTTAFLSLLAGAVFLVPALFFLYRTAAGARPGETVAALAPVVFFFVLAGALFTFGLRRLGRGPTT